MRHYLSSDKKISTTQPLVSAFLKKNREVKKSNHEHDLLNIIDCFISGHTSVHSDYVFM